MNPADCTCEFEHCSSPTCPSIAPSHGAVKDSQRLNYPLPEDVVLRIAERITDVERDVLGDTLWPSVITDIIRKEMRR
jgi:hypothetical protein